LRQDLGAAQVVAAAAVLYHVEDLRDVVRGIAALLADGGVACVQFIYLWDVIDRCGWDAIYHEHLCYFDLTSLGGLLAEFGLGYVDLWRLPHIHAGSIVALVGHEGAAEPAPRVSYFLDLDAQRRSSVPDAMARLARSAHEARTRLRDYLVDLAQKGRRVACYGAPARGNTLLNYCQIGPELVEYAVERNPLKCNRLTPGQHIPVIHEDAIGDTVGPPDVYLLLAWNFRDEIFARERPWEWDRTRFIVPLPTLELV
jgi:C-methyltransferase C-terminal domain/Methyltransferase domain